MQHGILDDLLPRRRTTASSALFMSSAPMPGAPVIMPSFDRRFTPLAPIGPSWPVDDTMTLHSSTCACAALTASALLACRVATISHRPHMLNQAG